MNAKIRGRRRNSVVAGIGAIVLLLGGTTFALWSASGDTDAGTISTGNLELFVGALNWYDVSSDRTDTTTTSLYGQSAHPIATMSDYRIVPGDSIEGDALFGVALEGDNMVAELKLEFDDDDATNLEVLLEDGVTLTYMVCPVTNNVPDCNHYLIAQDVYNNTLDTALTAEILFQASGSGQASGSPDSVGASTLPSVSYTALPTSASGVVDQTKLNYAVMIFVGLPDSLVNRQKAQLSATLGNLTISLTQTRNPSDGNFTSPAAG
jgi:alternate signal-mediated exported protein